jgi:hypothetical protein
MISCVCHEAHVLVPYKDPGQRKVVLTLDDGIPMELPMIHAQTCQMTATL